MSIPFQVRHLSSATRLATTPLSGELIYDTQTDELFSGDGSTAGGILIGGGTDGYLVPISDKATSFSILAPESGTRFTNAGAAGTVVGSLPAATVGLNFGFSVAAAQVLRADANGTDTINWAGTISAAGGTIEGNVVGWFLAIECHVTGKWTVTVSQGGWTVT